MISDNFTFNGRHSLNDMGLHTEVITRPLFAEPKTVYEDIPGTDGEMSFTSANPKGRMCFKPRIIELECHFSGAENSHGLFLEKASALAAWLATDENKVLTFDDEEGIQYLAHAANLFNIQRITDFTGTFPLIFKCEPFRYSSDTLSFVSDKNLNISNNGYFTPPVITVEGSAPNGFTLVNGTIGKKITISTTLNGAAAVVDMGNMTVAVNGISALHDCEGEFFELIPGDNSLYLEDDPDLQVTLTVQYRQRYL